VSYIKSDSPSPDEFASSGEFFGLYIFHRMLKIFQNYKSLILQILLFAINYNGSIRMTRSLVSTWAAWTHSWHSLSPLRHAAQHSSRTAVILPAPWGNKTVFFRFVKNL
jgi:hypothetical protein